MMETTARFLNETAVECAFLSTMQAQEINLHLLSSTAVTEPRFSRASPVITVRCPFPRAVAARFTSGIRRIKITLTGVASLVPGIRPACSSLFDVNTVQKFGKDVICVLRNKEIYVFFLSPSPRIVADAVGNKVRIGFSNNNLRCRGQKFFVAGSGSTQNLEIPLPTANVKAVISHGGDTLGKSSIVLFQCFLCVFCINTMKDYCKYVKFESLLFRRKTFEKQLKALSPYKYRSHDQYQLLFNHKTKLSFNPY